MLDIVKEGIKIYQSVALFPLRAARRLIDDRNTGARQIVDIAEDFISMPFAAATRAIDNTCQPCGVKKNPAGDSAGGPALRNIWVDPEVTVFSDVETKPGERRAVLTVTGLLCGG